MTDVIIVVQGYSPHFKHCLESIRMSTPCARIHVIGDEVTANFIECEPSDKYSRWAEKFEKVFKYLSVNSFSFELQCYQRWFIMYEYVIANGITEFWSFDWDELVWTDLSKEVVGIGMTTPLHVFYCRELSWFKQWLELIYTAFESRNFLFKQWEKFYLGGQWTSIADMYTARWTAGHLNFFEEFNPSGMWDQNMTTSYGGFVMEKSCADRTQNSKKMRWVNGKPQALHETGLWIPMKTFHCWGSHKNRTAEYLEKAITCEQTLL